MVKKEISYKLLRYYLRSFSAYTDTPTILHLVIGYVFGIIQYAAFTDKDISRCGKWFQDSDEVALYLH